MPSTKLGIDREDEQGAHTASIPEERKITPKEHFKN